MDNVIVVIMIVVFIAAGVGCWWLGRDTGEDENEDKNDK